jgi:hypothetical protein
MLTEYDARQLGRMLQRIDAYERDEIVLRRLIDDVEGLIAALESMPATQKEEIRSAWGALEDRYAVALDQKVPTRRLAPEYQSYLANLRTLIEAALAE